MNRSKNHYLALFKRAKTDLNKYNYPEKMNILAAIKFCEIEFNSRIISINAINELEDRLSKWINFFSEESK